MNKIILSLLLISTVSMSVFTAPLGEARVRFILMEGARFFKQAIINLGKVEDVPALIRHLCIKNILHDESVPTFFVEEPFKVLMSADDWMSLNEDDVVMIQKNVMLHVDEGGGGAAAQIDYEDSDEDSDEDETKDNEQEQV